jgi:hypothetical protein
MKCGGFGSGSVMALFPNSDRSTSWNEGDEQEFIEIQDVSFPWKALNMFPCHGTWYRGILIDDASVIMDCNSKSNTDNTKKLYQQVSQNSFL